LTRSRDPGSARSRSWLVHAVVRTAVLLLLLRTASPLMAVAAAALQGKPVSEVCEVYGVALPSQKPAAAAGHHHAHEHAHHGAPDQSDPKGASHTDHCPLTTLALPAPLGAPASLAIDRPAAFAAPKPSGTHPVWDASARWVERLEPGPSAAA
jgi:hypothetical protein